MPTLSWFLNSGRGFALTCQGPGVSTRGNHWWPRRAPVGKRAGREGVFRMGANKAPGNPYHQKLPWSLKLAKIYRLLLC